MSVAERLAGDTRLTQRKRLGIIALPRGHIGQFVLNARSPEGAIAPLRTAEAFG